MRILILVAALSLHAVFEGLVFGLARGNPAELFGTITAVLIHKSIIAFSTGMQLLTSEIPENGVKNSSRHYLFTQKAAHLKGRCHLELSANFVSRLEHRLTWNENRI